jgi:hypothetical protein
MRQDKITDAVTEHDGAVDGDDRRTRDDSVAL